MLVLYVCRDLKSQQASEQARNSDRPEQPSRDTDYADDPFKTMNLFFDKVK
jgi:hypothetical protein